MSRSIRTFLLGLALLAIDRSGSVASASPPDCLRFVLDGYSAGMPGDEALTLRPNTVRLEGQAQVVVPGKLSGVLVVDASNRLETWDVVYEAPWGNHERARLLGSLGKPASDVTGIQPGDGTSKVTQRRTIWRSTECDAAIILYEDTGAAGRTVHATLIRASKLAPGLVEMKTLLP